MNLFKNKLLNFINPRFIKYGISGFIYWILTIFVYWLFSDIMGFKAWIVTIIWSPITFIIGYHTDKIFIWNT